MRGKGNAQLLSAVYERITPAYAGKSTILSPPIRHSRDHPRVCGEKLKESSSFCVALGSPPRMRGKVAVLLSIFII